MLRALAIVAAALAGIGVAGFGAAAFGREAGEERAAARVTLQVAPRGLGSVSADPPGLDSDNQPVASCSRNEAQHSCEWGYERGTTVTLMAKPDSATGRSLAGWSMPDCPGTGTCKLVLDDDLTSVVALFTPLRLAVRLSNSAAGVASTNPAGAPCRQEFHDEKYVLCREFSPGTQVTVTVTPTAPHTFKAWNPGCTPVGPTSCTITVLDEGTWVGASFDNDQQPNLPTTITVQFWLRKHGDGTGRVTSSKLDCGSQCGAQYNYGSSLTLTAAPDNGSVFDGWGGVCAATQTRCTIPVGPITAVDARFAHVPARPSRPSSLTVTKRTATTITLSWAASIGGAGVTGYRVYVNGAARADTANRSHTLHGLKCGRSYTVAVDSVDARGNRSERATTTARTAPCLAARLTGLRVTRPGGARTIVIRLSVNQAARARVSLGRNGRVVLRRSYVVRRGKTALNVRVPRTLAGGHYRLRVKLTAKSGAAQTLRPRDVVVPRRR